MQKIELRCEICSLKFDSNYNVPKVLSCGHTVCAKCVDRMRDKSINKCPFDRKVLDFADEQVAINYYILSLIDSSVKDVNPTIEDEALVLMPRPVINSPGWKNTMDGFIKNDVLYTVETNGFIYCTDLNTGEWWFMYHNQFFGNFFFENPIDNKMYLIDQYGSLFQIFNKNYYVQIGKKNAWKNTTHMTVYNNKLYSLESSNKFYETNLQNGKWKEIVITKFKNKHQEPKFVNSSGNSMFFSKSGGNGSFSKLIPESEDDAGNRSENESKFFKNVNMIISTQNFILFSNKNGEMYSFNEPTGEAKLIKRDFYKNIEAYYANSTHVYFFEKNSKVICRTAININSKIKLNNNVDAMNSVNSEDAINTVNNSNLSNNLSNNSINKNNKNNKNNITEIIDRLSEMDLKKQQERIKTNSNINIINIINNDNTPHETPHDTSTISPNILINNKSFLETEVFIDLEIENILSVTNSTIITPLKLIADDKRLVIIDKIGDIYVFNLQTRKQVNKFQCLFMLRNCHLSNTALIGDGDLLLLDPIRLSLNKLNIIAGTEVIVLHSTKFLYTIKHIFSANSRIYFIDTTGNLYLFNEIDKKLTQIGNNSICKYIIDFAVYRNYILTIENNTLYRTNLNDGNYIEIKNDFCKNYEYFFADNLNVVFITRDDEILISSLTLTATNKEPSDGVYNDVMKMKKSIKYDKISKMSAVTYFRNHIVFYNKDKRRIEAIDIEDESDEKEEGVKNIIMVESFPDVNMFISNNDFLACISKDGVIYKLYC